MKLTKVQRDLLCQMVFREAEPGGPCWVLTTPSGRYALYVMTMMGSYGYFRTIAGVTLQALHSAGYIQYGENQRVSFRTRAIDPPVGLPVTITQAGRDALDGGR